MTIFDVLRYGQTDLGYSEVLMSLPDDLLNAYWDLADYAKRTTNPEKHIKCGLLAMWYRSNGHFGLPDNEWFVYNFNRALLEYKT